MTGIAIIVALGWLGYSIYAENNQRVDLDEPRSEACQSMTGIGALDKNAGEQCLTDNAVYLTGLRAAIETNANRIQAKMNKVVEEVSETASRLDAAVFMPMPARRFFDIHEPFPIDDAVNSALKRVQVDVSHIKISAPLAEAPDGLPTMWVLPESMEVDELRYSVELDSLGRSVELGGSGYGVDLDERVFEVMEHPYWFRCQEIVKINGGCQGTLFIDLRSDGIMGATPVIIGFDMAPLTEKQATEIAFGILAPHFSDTSEEYDAARMKEVAELF
jgi:hypothetical protein